MNSGAFSISGILSSDQGLRQLVRAGGLLHTAGNTFDPGNGFVHVHTFYQSCNAFQVAVAAAHELNIFNLVILNVEINHLRAGALGLVLIHNQYPFCL